MKPLFEQYRPASWDDVVGQDKAIRRFRAIAKRGIGGRSFWITGQSGTGISSALSDALMRGKEGAVATRQRGIVGGRSQALRADVIGPPIYPVSRRFPRTRILQ